VAGFGASSSSVVALALCSVTSGTTFTAPVSPWEPPPRSAGGCRDPLGTREAAPGFIPVPGHRAVSWGGIHAPGSARGAGGPAAPPSLPGPFQPAVARGRQGLEPEVSPGCLGSPGPACPALCLPKLGPARGAAERGERSGVAVVGEHRTTNREQSYGFLRYEKS